MVPGRHREPRRPGNVRRGGWIRAPRRRTIECRDRHSRPGGNRLPIFSPTRRRLAPVAARSNRAIGPGHSPARAVRSHFHVAARLRSHVGSISRKRQTLSPGRTSRMSEVHLGPRKRIYNLHAHALFGISCKYSITSSVGITSPRSMSMSTRFTRCMISHRSPTASRGTITRKLLVASRQLA